MSKDADSTILKSLVRQIMFWHSYPRQHYSNRSAIERIHDGYYVELKEEHSDYITLPEENFLVIMLI